MKRVPQYGEMVPGRLEGKLRGLSIYILKACPILDRAIHYRFYTRKMKTWRRYDLRWWNRLETAFTRGFDAANDQ